MGIINKFKNFIQRLFSGTKTLPTGYSETVQVNKTNSNNSFIDALQKSTKDYSKQNEILNEINKNPDLIYTLSYQRLVQLNQLYENRIKELEKKLYV